MGGENYPGFYVKPPPCHFEGAGYQTGHSPTPPQQPPRPSKSLCYSRLGFPLPMERQGHRRNCESCPSRKARTPHPHPHPLPATDRWKLTFAKPPRHPISSQIQISFTNSFLIRTTEWVTDQTLWIRDFQSVRSGTMEGCKWSAGESAVSVGERITDQ